MVSHHGNRDASKLLSLIFCEQGRVAATSGKGPILLYRSFWSKPQEQLLWI